MMFRLVKLMDIALGHPDVLLLDYLYKLKVILQLLQSLKSLEAKDYATGSLIIDMLSVLLHHSSTNKNSQITRDFNHGNGLQVITEFIIMAETYYSQDLENFVSLSSSLPLAPLIN